MTHIPLTIRSSNGKRGDGAADLHEIPDGERVGKTVGFVVAGCALGAALIVVPIVHLLTTWALPLAGAMLGRNAWMTRARLGAVEGHCPSCEAPLSLEGSGANFPMRETCGGCGCALELDRADDREVA
jgi:hypothetical protein